jgi:hypothetical protein
MPKGVRAVAVGTALVASAVLLGGSIASADPEGDRGDGEEEVTLEFDVRASPFSYTDVDPPGFSAADVIVFNDVLLRDGSQVGHEVGSCVVVDPTGVANCTGVVTLDGEGTLSFAFENAPPPEKVFSITGGTGTYRDAGGEGVFVESGTEQDAATLTLSVTMP